MAARRSRASFAASSALARTGSEPADVVGQSEGSPPWASGGVVRQGLSAPLGRRGRHLGDQTTLPSGVVPSPQLAEHPALAVVSGRGVLLAQPLGRRPLPAPASSAIEPPLALAQGGNLPVRLARHSHSAIAASSPIPGRWAWLRIRVNYTLGFVRVRFCPATVADIPNFSAAIFQDRRASGTP